MAGIWLVIITVVFVSDAKNEIGQRATLVQSLGTPNRRASMG